MNLFRTLALAIVAAGSAIGSHFDRAPEIAAAKHVTVIVAERTPAPSTTSVGCSASLLPCRPESEPAVALHWPALSTR